MTATVTAPAKHVFIFVNGIFAFPGKLRGWTDRAVTNTHTLHDFKSLVVAEKFEYLAGALTRRLRQSERVKALHGMMTEYQIAGYKIHLVGHSNGCDIICRVLKRIFMEKVSTIHLFAPACEADFNENGINDVLAGERLGGVFLYGSRNDRALKLGQLSRKVLKPIGLGYGSLGLTGPVNLKGGFQNRYVSCWRNLFGHSTWWDTDHFAWTMKMIFQNTRRYTDFK